MFPNGGENGDESHGRIHTTSPQKTHPQKIRRWYIYLHLPYKINQMLHGSYAISKMLLPLPVAISGHAESRVHAGSLLCKIVFELLHLPQENTTVASWGSAWRFIPGIVTG